MPLGRMLAPFFSSPAGEVTKPVSYTATHYSFSARASQKGPQVGNSHSKNEVSKSTRIKNARKVEPMPLEGSKEKQKKTTK